MTEKITGKLPIWRKLLWACASIGLNILSVTMSTWLLYFYSPPKDSGRQVFLPITLVGILWTVVTIWDAVIDPFIGHFSDNLRTKFGRRRPLMAIGAPLAALGMIFIWTPPATDSILINSIYFVLLTFLFYTSFSITAIPYNGLLAEMVTTNKERVSLASWQNFFGIIGVLIGSLFAAPLFETVGPKIMGIIVGIVSLVSILISLPAIIESPKDYEEKENAIEGIKTALKNKQFLVFFFAIFLMYIFYAMLLANMPYFITLVLKQPEDAVGTYQGIIVIFMALSAPLWNYIGQRKNNKKIIRWTMLGCAVVTVVIFAVGIFNFIPINFQATIAFGLMGPFLGGFLIIAFAILGNVVDYDEYITGRRREAVYYGSFSLSVGLGPAIASLILPIVLETFGYTIENPLGVRIGFLAMTVLILAGYFLFGLYKLGDSLEETKDKMNLD